MIETGEVIDIKNGKICVRFKRKADCDKCGMCNFSKNSEYFVIELENTVNAEKGDTVKVEMPNKTILFSSFMAYIIPLVFTAAGLIIGYFLGGDGFALILAGACFIIGFVFIIFAEKFLRRNNIIRLPKAIGIEKIQN